MRGRKRSRTTLKNSVLTLLTREGSQSWKEIFTKIDWRENKKLVTECLDELRKQNMILRIEKSHKNVRYSLAETEDLTLSKSIRDRMHESDEMFPKVREEIAKSKYLTTSQATKFYADIIKRMLVNFTLNMESWVRAEEKWQDFAKQYIDEDFLIKFGLMLGDCGHANPIATDEALKYVRGILKIP
jgi:hypothetical protein